MANLFPAGFFLRHFFCRLTALALAWALVRSGGFSEPLQLLREDYSTAPLRLVIPAASVRGGWSAGVLSKL